MEHRYLHSQLKYHNPAYERAFMLASALKNSANPAIGDLGMLLRGHPLKSLNSVEKIQLKMKCASFDCNPCTTIVSGNSPTSTNDEIEITTFYNELLFIYTV